MEAPEPLDDLVRWARRIALGIVRVKHMFHCADLAESAALEALSRALNSYDPARGSFRAYAVKGIAGAVFDQIGPEARRLSIEVAFDAVEMESISGEDGEIAPEDVAAVTALAVMDALVLAYAGESNRLDGEAALLRGETLETLRAQLAHLPARDHRLVKLRYWEGLNWPAVGASLQLSERTAREHDLRIRKHLKGALLAFDEAPTEP